MKRNTGLKISIVLNLILCTVLIISINSNNQKIIKKEPVNSETAYKIQYVERISLFESIPTTHADVVFLGDSLTQNGLWNELFPDISLVNRGIRGDTTSGVLKRLNNVIKLQPKKLFLMIGVNDLHRRVDKETIVRNYKQIIEIMRKQSPETTIYIQSILPVVKNKYKIRNTDIDWINQKIKTLADGKNIFFIDINSKLRTADNELDLHYTVDGEHLKGNAYRIWADEIRGYLY